MSNIISIKAQTRSEKGTAAARRLRRAGYIPVVIYAHGNPAVSLTLTEAEAQRAIRHTGLLDMTNEDGHSHTALVKEVQIHPLTNKILHIDFLAVNRDEVVESTVRVECTGEAVGTRAGGQLEQVLHEITIKSLPTAIPEAIYADVTALEVDQALCVKDLVLPEGVTAITDGAQIVCHVRVAKAEEPAETTEASAEEPAAAAAETK